MNAWVTLRAIVWRQHDALTGLGNRRCFEQVLQRQHDHCRQLGKPLTLVHIEVDHLKQHADTLGPRARDQVVRHIAGLLGEQSRRPGDAAARLGGGEFALVLPDTTRQGAVHLVENLIGQIRQQRLADSAEGVHPISISAGLYTAIPGAPSVPDQFKAQAAEALYNAQAAGRDGYFAAPLDID
ncbi:MAG: GGDEF domain-containing protein [Stenotrophomonas sp.]